MLIGRLGVQTVVHVFQLRCIAQVAVVSLAAHNPVIAFVGEVDGTDGYLSFIGGAGSVLLCRIGVADGMAIVTTDTDAQAGNRIVVNAHGATVLVGNVKLQRRLRTLVNPSRVGEVIGVQTCQELCLVAPVTITAPERGSRLMPGGRHDDVLAFWTIDGKEIQRFMIGIVQTHRNHDVSHLQVGP